MTSTHFRYRALITGLVMAVWPAWIQAQSLSGFTPSGRQAVSTALAKAAEVPTPDNARRWLLALTEEPHVAGTEADYETAVFVRDRLRDWGWDADLAPYDVLLNYPEGEPSLRILRPEPMTLKVREDPHLPDKDSASLAVFPAFHGYGVSGQPAGQVVYANYGRIEDFDQLEKGGIGVKDKIVLVRYGQIFRGLKVLNAQRRGAAGVLIYSDPADDGYMRGDVYPNGPYRPASAIQRGSVQFLSQGPGDPSTPGWASTPGAKRLPIDPRHGFPIPQTNPGAGEGQTDAVALWEKETGLNRLDYFATIPSLPISYESAAPILAGLGGPNVPSGWQGGLPLAYHLGSGPVEVEFRISMDYKIRTVWNVVATLAGSVEPDRWVMIGNHRDAWTYGAVDPNSGTAATLEACRALGEAVKSGWKPRRTLVYCSWDAEEYGLVGSTEWAEDHAADLSAKAVMMLNVDSAVSGSTLDLDGIPSMRDLLLEAAATVRDSRTGKTLRDLWVSRQRDDWAGQAPLDLDAGPWTDAAPLPLASFSPQMTPLGSGSDYTAFVHHLGIPAVDANFGGRYGVYHSLYDNFFWMDNFGDPGFVTHATAARLYAAIAVRMAGAEVVPLTFVPYADALRDHIDDLRRALARKSRSSEEPKVTAVDFPPLIEAAKRFRAAAEALDTATAQAVTQDREDPAAFAPLNDALMKIERAMLAPEGLPGRPWFKHALYAPGLTTGYASWPLPALRKAILDDDSATLAAQVPIVVRQIDAATAAINEAARLATALAPPS